MLVAWAEIGIHFFACTYWKQIKENLTQNFVFFSVALMKAQEQLYDIQTEVKQKVNTETYIDFVNFNFHFSLIFCFNLNFDSIQSLDLKVLELDLKKKCHLILNTQAMAKENLVNKARNLGVRASQHTAKVINQVQTFIYIRQFEIIYNQGNHNNHGN